MNNYMNNLAQLMSMGNTPQQIIQNVIAQNPQAQQVFSQMGPNMNARQMVMQIAQQRGININQMMQFIQQRGMKL